MTAIDLEKEAALHEYFATFNHLLTNQFSADELGTLCLELGALEAEARDALVEEGKGALAETLIAHVRDQGRTQELIQACALLRPDIDMAELLAWDVEELLETPDEESPLHRFRPPVQEFLGRDDVVERLHQALTREIETGATLLLCGQAGVGKTELAYALAQQAGDLFSEDHLLIDLHGSSNDPLSPQQALRHIIHTFEPQAQLSDNPEQLRRRYLAVLQDRQVLILADDATTTEQIEALLPPAGCALIVTTRADFDLPGAVAEDLPPLLPGYAAQLVQTICPRAETAAPWLAEACGCIPLALWWCASRLAFEEDLEIEDYLHMVAEQRQQLPPAEKPDSPAPELLAVLRVSYHLLSLPEQRTLCQLRVFPASFDLEAAMAVVSLHEPRPAKASGKQKARKGSKKGGHNKKEAQQGEPQQSEQQQSEQQQSEQHDELRARPQRGRAAPPSIEQIMEQLYRLNLVEYDPVVHRYNLHAVVLAFIEAQAGNPDPELMQRYARHYAEVVLEVEQLYQMGDEHLFEGLSLFDRERAHIDYGWDWAREQQEDELVLKYSLVLGFTGVLRYHLRNEYLPRAQETLEVAQRLRRRENESHALNDLGYAYNLLGDPRQAIDCFVPALKILRTSHNLKKKVKKEGAILSNLGQAYLRVGEAPKSLEQSKLRLELALASNDWRGEGIALNNLGLAYADLGKIEQALTCYQKSLDLSRKYGERNGEATDLGNMGRAYILQGDVDQAVSMCEEALNIKWELGNSRDEGYAQSFLGLAYAAAGDTQRAMDAQQQALDVAHEMGDRWLEEFILNNMGEIYLQQSEWEAAREKFEHSLALAQEIGDQRGASVSGWNLGILIEQQSTTPDSPAQISRDELARAVELMQARVTYEQSIKHPAAEEHASHLASMRERLGLAEETEVVEVGEHQHEGRSLS